MAAAGVLQCLSTPVIGNRHRTACSHLRTAGTTVRLFTPGHRSNHIRRLAPLSGRDAAVKVHAQDSSAGAEEWENPKAQTEVPKTLTFGQRARGRAAFQYRKGDVLDGRYTVIQVLGTGSSAVTYKCRGPGGRDVAVKGVSLAGMTDWRDMERLEREATVLQSLDHPGIPRFVDSFEIDSPRDRAFFLVQELAEGTSLSELVAAGWRPSETQVARIARQLASTLAHLRSRSVVHRDVKPENIVLDGASEDGRAVLVDFGGALSAGQTAQRDLLGGGGTFVGTLGYAAPEQFSGIPHPECDMYGLGGTLLFLLSGQPPSAFPQRRLRLDTSSLKVGSRMRGLLDGLLDPQWETRLTPDQAISILDGQTVQRPVTVSTLQDAAERLFSKDGLQAAAQNTASALRQAASSAAAAFDRATTLDEVTTSGGTSLERQAAESSPASRRAGNPGFSIAATLGLLAAATFAPGLLPMLAFVAFRVLAGNSRQRGGIVYRSGPSTGVYRRRPSMGMYMVGAALAYVAVLGWFAWLCLVPRMHCGVLGCHAFWGKRHMPWWAWGWGRRPLSGWWGLGWGMSAKAHASRKLFRKVTRLYLRLLFSMVSISCGFLKAVAC